MTTSRLAPLRPAMAVSFVLTAAVALAACSTADDRASVAPSSPPATARASATPPPTPSATPTPAPTPRFTNEPDEDLAALIPTDAAGAGVVIAPFDEFALTPGDIGLAYGEIGDRFASLALSYALAPRLTLYAMRVDGEAVTTEDLEPHLATAGRYVGIAGLDREPWELTEAGGYRVWARPEDNATASGTMIYTWSSGEFVFLLIGVDDTVNRDLIAQLPGEPAPSPTPRPSGSTPGSPRPSAADDG